MKALYERYGADPLGQIRNRAGILATPMPERPSPLLPAPTPGWALFLDVDGTLLEFADQPHHVVVPENTRALLRRLTATFGGAVAVVSGRSVETLDRLFAPLALPAAGLHGLERRSADGRLHRPEIDTRALDPARSALESFTRAHPGTILEDKGFTVALHFRAVPNLAAAAEDAVRHATRQLGEAFELQRGKMVLEIRPTGARKGDVVEAFLEEPPFRGRTPIFIGDDVTDEDGFRAVNASDGHSIRVGCGRETRARYCVENIAALRTWLESVAARTGTRDT